MNQNGYNNGQRAGYGQPNGYPTAGYPAGSTYPGSPSASGYQAMQTQGYPSGQGYPQGQGYAAPGYGQASADQTTQGGRQAQGYQTPQVTGSQPRAGSESGYTQQGIYYQNPYAQQNFAASGGYASGGGYPASASYQPQGGYPAAGQSGSPQGYTYPGAQAQPGGSYIPQTPYSQGYTSPGYPGQSSAYGQGYNAFGQMGRNQQMPSGQPMQDSARMAAMNPMAQDTNRQMPLNGGGYVPQPVPVKRRPFQMKDADLLILSAILLILFALGMFVPTFSLLKWIFLALSAGTIALLWFKPLVATNKRLCYTIVFVLLMAVTVFSVIRPGQSAGGGTTAPSGQPGQVQAPGSEDVNAGSPQVLPETAAPVSSVTPTPEPTDDHSVTERLETFFYYWSANRQDDMLTLCAPSWQSKVENPKTALFGLMANRTPKDYMVESVSGTDYDTSRTVTVTSSMDRNNGKDPVKYRLSVIMLKEADNQWYVDPQSLQTYEAAETPDPSITSTPAPTETPAIYANTVLYYNPSGGEYYHLDQNCKRINERYLPLKGHFTYSELGKDPYNKLKPCAICGAPSKE